MLLNLEIKDINVYLVFLHIKIRKIENQLRLSLTESLIINFFTRNKTRITNQNSQIKR